MMALRQARWFVAVVACAAAVAWLVAANHCALASLAAHTAKAAHACCHEESAPHDQPTLPPAMQCCDALKAAIPAQAIVPAAQLHELLQSVWLAAEISAPTAVAQDAFAAAATGPPPRVATFVEIVLNRSLLAHAPPVFVA